MICVRIKVGTVCAVIKIAAVIVLPLVGLAMLENLSQRSSPISAPAAPSIRLPTMDPEAGRNEAESYESSALANSPTPTSEAIATPTPPTPSGIKGGQLTELHQQMLDLINAARRQHGLVEVVLDDNPTAQMHAEDARANCFSGHWGSNGMKPYMRYTLNGGIHYSAENVIGSSYCPPDPHRYREPSLKAEVTQAHRGLMNSPGHRRTILNPSYRRVGIGISFEHPNLRVVQLFTTDHIEFTVSPRIRFGDLIFAYKLTNDSSYTEYPQNAAVFWDPLPYDLTHGQLARSSCVGLGKRVAGIRPQPPPGSSWTDQSSVGQQNPCPNPYHIERGAKPPTSYEEASRLHNEALMIANRSATTETAPWITSSVDQLPGGGFHVTTDLSPQIAQFGPGVYTLVIWANVDGESAQVAEYAIFLETTE